MATKKKAPAKKTASKPKSKAASKPKATKSPAKAKSHVIKSPKVKANNNKFKKKNQEADQIQFAEARKGNLISHGEALRKAWKKK